MFFGQEQVDGLDDKTIEDAFKEAYATDAARDWNGFIDSAMDVLIEWYHGMYPNIEPMTAEDCEKFRFRMVEYQGYPSEPAYNLTDYEINLAFDRAYAYKKRWERDHNVDDMGGGIGMVFNQLVKMHPELNDNGYFHE